MTWFNCVIFDIVNYYLEIFLSSTSLSTFPSSSSSSLSCLAIMMFIPSSTTQLSLTSHVLFMQLHRVLRRVDVMLLRLCHLTLLWTISDTHTTRLTFRSILNQWRYMETIMLWLWAIVQYRSTLNFIKLSIL